jgi:16S rRNA (cytidine1402-2'-O)-methyltransferase
MKTQRSFSAGGQTLGTLYLVATPIGNLEDMTFRAVNILREVKWIAAEDTRQTRKLLTHFDISTRLVSYHEHNKEQSGRELIRLMSEGASVALVSDAGTPVISDPGYELVRLAIEEGIPVVPIPGANAAINALIGSGLPTDSFTYIGFLPRDKKSIGRKLTELLTHPHTLIFYESPYRVEKTLEQMYQVWGNRRAVLVRELTKRYEEWTRGTIESCLEWVREHGPKGEYCIVTEGADLASQPSEDAWWEPLDSIDHVDHYLDQGMSQKDAIKQVAADRDQNKREIYQTYHNRL